MFSNRGKTYGKNKWILVGAIRYHHCSWIINLYSDYGVLSTAESHIMAIIDRLFSIDVWVDSLRHLFVVE
jgi:hypothetical protein